MNQAQMLAKADKSVLVLIDIQQRLIAAMPKDISNQLIRQTKILLQAADSLHIPVMITEQYPKGLGHSEPELLTITAENSVIEKTCFSCANVDEFMVRLHTSNRRQIILTGMESHICVLQTALQLQSQGFQVFIIEDAVCSRTKQNHNNALHRCRQAGVIISNTESVLFEWLADAKHKQFRTLSRLIV